MSIARVSTVIERAAVAFLLAGATLVVLAVSNTQTTNADEAHTVSGTITAPGGTGLSNVSVYATEAGSDTAIFGPVTSSVLGTYSLGVAPGTYDLYFDPPGTSYDTVVQSSVTISGNQTVNVQFIPAVRTFSGTLTDSQNNPLPNVDVALQTGSGGSVVSGRTASNGSFSLNAAPGVYRLSITQNLPSNIGLQQNTTGINLTDGNVVKDLVLNVVPIHVTVTDSQGVPLSGIQVSAYGQSGTISLYPGDPGSRPLLPHYVKNNTDANGMVTLSVVAGLSYSTTASNGICALIAGLYSCASPRIVNGEASLTIAQPVTRTFSGTLTDSQNNPLSGINLQLATGFGGSTG